MDIKEIQKNVLDIMKEIDKICQKNNLTYSLVAGGVLGAIRHKGFIPWDPDMDIIIPIDQEERFRKAMKDELPTNMRIYVWEEEKDYHPCFDRISIKGVQQELLHVDVFALCGMPANPKEKHRFINACYYLYHILSCRIKNPEYSKRKNRWKVSLIKVLLFPISDKTIKAIYYKLKHKYSYAESTDVYNIATRYKDRDFTDKSKLFDSILVDFEDWKFPIPREYDLYLSSLYGDYMTPVQYD